MTKSVRWLVLAVAAVGCALVVTESASAQILPWRRHHNQCCQTACCAPTTSTCCAASAPTGGCNACGSCSTGYAHQLRRRHNNSACCTPCGYQTAMAGPACCGGVMPVMAAMPAPPTGAAPMPLPTAQPGTAAAPPPAPPTTGTTPMPPMAAPVPVVAGTGCCGGCGAAPAVASNCCCEDPCAHGRRHRLFHRNATAY